MRTYTLGAAVQGSPHDLCLLFHAQQQSQQPPGLYDLIYEVPICVHLPFLSELYEAELEQASTLVPLHADARGVLGDHLLQTHDHDHTWGAAS